MAANTKDTPGVIAPPPLIYLGFLLAGFLIDFFLPFPVLPDGLQFVAGGVLIAAGFIPVTLAFRLFRKAGTNVPTRKPATAVVTTGPYRFTRNPIYLGMTTIYAGIAVTGDSIWVLGFLLPVLLIMNRGVIAREEKYLDEKFGETYRQYKRTVRRWW